MRLVIQITHETIHEGARTSRGVGANIQADFHLFTNKFAGSFAVDFKSVGAFVAGTNEPFAANLHVSRLVDRIRFLDERVQSKTRDSLRKTQLADGEAEVPGRIVCTRIHKALTE